MTISATQARTRSGGGRCTCTSADDAIASARSLGFTWIKDEAATIGGNARVAAQLAYVKKNHTGTTLRHIRVAMNRAWARLLSFRVHEALGITWIVEPGLADIPARKAEDLKAEITVLRAVAFGLSDEILSALPVAQSCLEKTSSPAITSIATTICRLAHWKLGDLSAFYNLRQPTPRTLGRHLAILFAFDRSLEAAVELQQLRFGTASRLAEDALAFAPQKGRRRSPITLLPTVILAQLLFERGSLPEAEELLRDRLPSVRASGSIESAIKLYPLLAKIAHGRGQGELAMFLLREGVTLAEKRGWERFAAACLAEKIGLLVRENRIAEAEAFCARLKGLLPVEDQHRPGSSAVQRYYSLARAQIEIAQHCTSETVATLRFLHHEAISVGDLYLGVQMAIRLAEALAVVGEEDDAAETLGRTLELGASVGMFQSFVEAGPAIVRLLAMVTDNAGTQGNRSHLRPFIDSLLMSWEGSNRSAGGLRASKASGALSSRECSILNLVRRGLSNKKIAQELSIAPETVKSHAKHIFVKLGVKTRVEAVSQAENVGLI